MIAVVAVAALVGIKLQLDATDHLQRTQIARDAYRAHLALATTHPDFARPADGCALIDIVAIEPLRIVCCDIPMSANADVLPTKAATESAIDAKLEDAPSPQDLTPPVT